MVTGKAERKKYEPVPRIEGVEVEQLKMYCDERGGLMELLRSDKPIFQKFGQAYVSITYPGVFTNASETPLTISRRAPLIGEHNEEIYEKELGLSREELLILKQAGII